MRKLVVMLFVFIILSSAVFAQAQKSINLPDTSICKADGVCSGNENVNNCPQDCGIPLQSLSQNNSYLLWIIIFGVAFILIALMTLIVLLIKRRRKT